MSAIVAIVAVAVVGVIVRRELVRRWTERAVDARLRVGADGIIPGAHGFTLRAPQARGAVLLLHGFGDTPQTLADLGASLHDRGWTVMAPLLPGHGRTLRAFAASTSAQWLGAARDALVSLRTEGVPIAIVGLSMGGALSVILAAESRDVNALVLLAPYLDVPSALRWAPYTRLTIAALQPYVASRDARSIHDLAAAARSLGYGAATARLLLELQTVADRARAALPAVTAPTLYVQSRDDNRIAPDVAERAFAALGAGKKRMEWLTGSGHVITVDYGRDDVTALVLSWLRERL